MNIEYIPNIIFLQNYMKKLSQLNEVDVAAISNQDDFHNYEDHIQFKYKMVNKKPQLNKICDFILECQEDYDWYIKLRPEIILLDEIDFESLCKKSINARARVYTGPQHIKYGSSMGGKGMWNYRTEINYSDTLKDLVLDDLFYIFHKNIIENGGFFPLTDNNIFQNEWFHTDIWRSRNINLNIININLVFIRNNKEYAYSGGLNPNL